MQELKRVAEAISKTRIEAIILQTENPIPIKTVPAAMKEKVEAEEKMSLQ